MMYEKTFDTLLGCFPNCYETQEMCTKAVSKEPFMLKYCHDKYTIKISLSLLKFVPD